MCFDVLEVTQEVLCTSATISSIADNTGRLNDGKCKYKLELLTLYVSPLSSSDLLNGAGCENSKPIKRRLGSHTQALGKTY